MSFSQSAQPVVAPAGNLWATGIGMGPNGMHQVLSKPVNTTRILLLAGFAPELKTRDLIAVFAEWEDQAGGFRIKWIDDQSAYAVFQDPVIAKKAFLATISNLPPSLAATTSTPPATLMPYAGPEADTIISSVANRPRSRSVAGGHNRYGSTSGLHHSTSNSNMQQPAFMPPNGQGHHQRGDSFNGLNRFSSPPSSMLVGSAVEEESPYPNGPGGRGSHHRAASSGTSPTSRTDAARHMASVLSQNR